MWSFTHHGISQLYVTIVHWSMWVMCKHMHLLFPLQIPGGLCDQVWQVRSRLSPNAPSAPYHPNLLSNLCSPRPPRPLASPGSPRWPPSSPARPWRASHPGSPNRSLVWWRLRPSRRSPHLCPHGERPPRHHHHAGASAQTPGSDRREHNQSLKVGRPLLWWSLLKLHVNAISKPRTQCLTINGCLIVTSHLI